MKTYFLHIFLYLIFLIEIQSQISQNWAVRYNGIGNAEDISRSITIDAAGNVYITGGCHGNGSGWDYGTIKYNSLGVQQWIAFYNGPGNFDDISNSIAVDGTGNVYVTGHSAGIGFDADYATIKYNSAGVEQWIQRYNGPGIRNDAAYSMSVDNSGNVYVTGMSDRNGTSTDYVTVKYNSAGVQQWIQIYNGTGNGEDHAWSIIVDILGNSYVTGSSQGIGVGLDYSTIKYNSSGVQQWVQRYNSPTNGADIAYSNTLDDIGNVYVTGESQASGINYDYATVKYNSSGVEQWAQRYNGPVNGEDIARSIKVDVSGNVYVTGESPGSGTGLDYATIKYNLLGIEQWVQRYNGPGNSTDYAKALIVDMQGNIFVTGASQSTSSGIDITSIKYNTSGIQQWVQRYNGPGNGTDIAYAIAMDDTGNVFVTGQSIGSGTNYDYATIKYSLLTGIINNYTIPEKFNLLQNFPNPFNPVTQIQFDIPKKSFSKLVLYDIEGKEVALLVEKELEAGSYQYTFDGSTLSSGVYFYKFESGYFNKTLKMILIK